MSENLLQPGRNCWRVDQARRVAFLIDGAAYFDAFRTAVERARRSIFIIGWDIDSQVRFKRDGDPGPTLAELLDRTVAGRRGLHAYVLIWDFAMIYALEREWLPSYKLGWRTHRRIRFFLDGNHPVGASQHQKVVVVDDQVAFVGGIDLTRARWDTPEHRADDPRRVEAWGVPYPPFHDVAALVDGEAARALAELARERWWRATGQWVAPVAEHGADPWPPQVAPDLEAVRVAVSRTQPRWDGRPEIREVERLYLDALAAARQVVYIENQYVTSTLIGDALAQALRRPDGPEVVLVLPQRSSGWLEQSTMDALRRWLLARLRAADRGGRFGLYYPLVPGLGSQCINIHSKVLVVDDRLLTLGSANLSNRSMGLDSECNLAIESGGDPRVGRAIAGLRDRLAGEHLGLPAPAVAAALERDGSLIALVHGRAGQPRRLEPLDPGAPLESDRLLAESLVVDPERPVAPQELLARFIPREHHAAARGRMGAVAAVLLLLLALAGAWRWTPLAEWFDVGRLAALVTAYRDNPATPLLVLAAYVLGGLVVAPVTVLVIVTALVFGPLLGFIYALAGALLSAAANFALGRLLGRDTVRRLAGGRLDRLARRMGRRELLTVVTLRLVPVAPFSIINLVAGVSHIRFHKFLAGTLLGMAPGILVLALFVNSVGSAIHRPDLANFAVVAAAAAALVLGAFALRRRLRRRRAGR